MRASGARPPLCLRAVGVGAKDLVADLVTGRVVGCSEATQYEIRVLWQQPCRLLVDEVELSPQPANAAGATNVWRWEAGFFAGEVAAELLDAGGANLANYRFDVSPDPAKLGAHDFRRMVEDLFQFEPRLVLGREASRTSIGVAGSATDPHLAYARLRLHGARFLAAMQQLSRHPQVQLFHSREHRAAHKIRRLDLGSLRSAFQNPEALALLLQRGRADATARTLFDVPAAHQGFDNPANRLMLGVLKAVRRRTRSVLSALEELATRNAASIERDALVARMPARRAFLSTLDTGLDKVQARRPFEEVTRGEISAAGLNAMSAHPLYARAYRTGWAILRAGIAGENGDESLWMSPTWAIFERWCFVKTISAMEELFPTIRWERRFPSSRDDCILFRGALGTRRVEVHLQPRFPAFDLANAAGFASISGERYPDIVVTVEDGGPVHFIVLDAKYRVTRANILDGMASAHLYRDSLRWQGRPPSCCLLLAPGGGGAPWLEEPEFWDRHGVGIAVVEAEKARDQLAVVLRRLLGQ